MNGISIAYRLVLADVSQAQAAQAFVQLEAQSLRSMRSQRTAAAAVARARADHLRMAQRILVTEKGIVAAIEAQTAAARMARRIGTGDGRDPLGKQMGRAGKIATPGALGASYFTKAGAQGRAISLLAGQVGTLIAVNAALLAGAGLLRVWIGEQAKLQESTAHLNIVLESTYGNIKQDLIVMQQQARSWSRAFGQAAAEIIEAEYDLGAAGLRSLEVMHAMPAVALLAQAGLLKLGDASQIVATDLQVFAREGKNAIDVANLYQEAADESLVMVQELGNAMRYVAGTFVTMNIPLQEGIALLGTLGTLGLRGSIAGTSLNQALSQLPKRSEELRKMGIEVEDATGKMRPFVDILEDMKRVFGTSISAGEQELLTGLFNKRGARSIQRLITDVQVLPRLMRELDDAQMAVFEKAEKGTDHLAESWQVFKNQFVDFFLGQGSAANFLQGYLDSLTGRIGLRSAQNISTASGGTAFELEKVEAAMASGRVAASNYFLELSRGADVIGGKFGAALKEIADRRTIIRDVWDRTGVNKFYRWVFPLSEKRIEQLKREMEATIKLQLRQEDLARGAKQIEATFGFKPVSSLTGRAAARLTQGTVQQQEEFALQQWEGINRRREQLLEIFGGGGGSFVDLEFENLAGAEAGLAAFLDKLKDDRDAARESESRDRILAIGQAEIGLAKAKIAALEATGAREFEVRRAIVEQSQALELGAIADLSKAKQDVLNRDIAERARTGDKENEALARQQLLLVQNTASQKRLRAERTAAKRLTEIELDELQQLYGAQRKLSDLRRRITLETASPEEKLQLQADFDFSNYERDIERAMKRYNIGDITAAVFQDELDLAGGNLDLADLIRARSAQKRAAQLAQLEGDITVAQAQQILLRTRGVEQFAQQEVLIEAAAAVEKGKINAGYYHDITGWLLAMTRLDQDTQNELTENNLKRIEFLQNAQLASFDVVGKGFQGMAALMEATGEQSAASTLRMLANVADATVKTISLVSDIQAGTISEFAGAVGIMGVVMSLGALMFGSGQRKSRDDARRLLDEFRHDPGKTVGADFGRAVVNNFNIDQTVNFRSLTSPTGPEQRQIARVLWDDIHEEFRTHGVL